MVQNSTGLALLRDVADRLSSNSAAQSRLFAQAEGVAPSIHLAIFIEPFLSAVMAGKKTIESRFAKNRCAPFGKVRPGDVILLKRSGGPVVGIAFAGRSESHELEENDLAAIRSAYAKPLFAEDDAFWEARATKRYATLIELEDPTPIEVLPVIKHDRRGWVTYGR